MEERQVPHTSPDRGDRLAEYGARATIHPPQDPHQRAVPLSRSLASAARTVLSASILLAAAPALLWMAGGNPLRRLPHSSEIPDWFARSSGRFTPAVLTGAALWALWLLWGVFALLLLAEILAAVTRWRIPALRLPAPLHRLVFGIAGTAAIAVTSAGSLDHTANRDQPPTPVAATDHVDIPRQATARGAAIIQVANQRYLYTVERHDTLSKIASEWLGDANRWPEICRLNKHRHFPSVGGTLRDCDLIYPGWELRLPIDARPPTAAEPSPPPKPPSDRPITPPAPPSAAPEPTDPAVPPPAATQPSAAPSASAVSPASSPTTTSPAPLPVSPTATDTPHLMPRTDGHGVQLSPSTWLPWSLAAAISAAAAMVWLHRRRRYTGDPDEDPPTELPTPVVQIRRALAAQQPTEPNLDNDGSDPPAHVPELASLPPGGTGITGDGGHAVARAALVAVLATGGPHHPDTRGEVVIDATTLIALLGPDATALQPWARLHVADGVDDALTAIEARLLHRSRILDEHTVTDLDALRRQAPDEEALPPVMLITQTPPPGAQMRAKTALTLGTDLGVSALLLGEWNHGVTVDVTPHGHTTLASGPATEPIPPRLPVLDATTALQILNTLREAQTGERSALASSQESRVTVPLQQSRNGTEPSGQHTPLASPAQTNAIKARLRVLGPPRIEDISQPGRPLRAKALELAVFLACHPDGVTTREIGEYLEPDARISQADQRVHTNASNLRHVLGRASTPDAKNAYVVKSSGRYRLDPTTVDVDVWTLRDLLRTATIATGPRRRELLTAACELYTAPLADGQDYEWLQPHRETVRRWGIEAHLLLADDLVDTDPQGASNLLNKAIGLDRYNEALYTRAMRVRHTLGDADGIRTLLRALTKALADLDAQPQEATITLASQLRSNAADRPK
ncbi:transcriptional regulator [Micromonospora echinaurantiaca]|uniref:transcriptional regulator n=1 Tax=Micromonospora echinaurantiaca TaxID=47857 RepID=UPI003417C35B